jgi:hypothetical protein
MNGTAELNLDHSPPQILDLFSEKGYLGSRLMIIKRVAFLGIYAILIFKYIIMKPRFWILPLLCIPLLFGVAPQKTNASAPECGDGFDTAGLIEEGTYEGGSLDEEESCYLSLDVLSGYEVSVEYAIEAGSFFGDVSLYDSSEVKLSGSTEQEDMLRWVGSHSDEEIVYLVLENSYATDSFTLDVGLIDRTDAGTGKDAGNDFDSSSEISFGSYTGYLSNFVYGAEGGNDDSDYYKVSVKRGDKISVQLTPELTVVPGCAVYDSGREELFNEDGLYADAGEIIQQSFDINQDGYIYVVVKWPFYTDLENMITEYEIVITNESVDDQGGESIGNTGDEDADTGDGASGINKSTLIILGSVIAGVVVLVLIVALVMILSKKGRKSSNSTDPSEMAESGKLPVDTEPGDK